MNESLTLRDIHTLLLNIPLYYFSAAETNSLTFIIMSLYNLDVSSWTENIMKICIYLAYMAIYLAFCIQFIPFLFWKENSSWWTGDGIF
jgi:hypothetical protein